jgi:hypothetical protein
MYQGFSCRDNAATVKHLCLSSPQAYIARNFTLTSLHAYLAWYLCTYNILPKKVLSYPYMNSTGLGQSPLLGPCTVVLKLWIQYSRKLLNTCVTIKLSINSYVKPLSLVKILVLCHRLPLLCNRTLAPKTGKCWQTVLWECWLKSQHMLCCL